MGRQLSDNLLKPYHFKIISISLPVIFCNATTNCLDVVSEPANKGTMLITQETLDYIESRQYRNGFSSISLMSASRSFIMFGMVFKPFSPLYETINEKVHHMMSGGIMQYLYREQHRSEKTSCNDKVRKREEPIGPQVLTMEHLQYGFLICLILLGLSFVVFAVEMRDSFYFSVVNTLTACSVVKAFLKNRKS